MSSRLKPQLSVEDTMRETMNYTECGKLAYEEIANVLGIFHTTL